MRWTFLAVLIFHGLIHFMGVAKAFGWADLPQLSQPNSRSQGILWLVAGGSLIASATLLFAAPRWWWLVGLVGLVVSQAAVLSAWQDAKFATLVNGVLLAGVAYGFASRGPMSFRARYENAVERRRAASPDAPVVSEADLAALPEPVACYLKHAGVVGTPRARHFKAVWRGRIRATPGDDWMEFTAEQHNFLTDPARFFIMDARRAGLPVDVFHAFEGGKASMGVRLLSMFPLVDVSGPELTRAETVTLLNDVTILAPSGLLGDALSLTWESIDERSARVGFTLGPNTVHAELKFDEHCDLIDFVSDDRLALGADKKEFSPQRWSTPLRGHRTFGAYRLAGHGEGRWHPPGGEFAYLELDLVNVRVNE